MFDRLKKMFKKDDQRSFQNALVDRFTENFLAEAIRTNEDIRRNLQTLRDRSRELSKNNGDYRKFLQMVERNVVGPNGIRLQMDVRTPRGKRDAVANAFWEDRWRKFCECGNCTVNRRQSMRRFLKQAVRNWRIDGEIFVRLVPSFQNSQRFALGMLDPAACPVTLNQTLANGRRIVMGVELDEWDAPTAYYFYARPEPGDLGGGQCYDPVFVPRKQLNGEAFVRIPAAEIIHFFDDELVGQVRGFPFGQAAMQEIYLLNSYIHSELVAADAASRKLGKMINRKLPAQYNGRNADGTQKELPTPVVKTEAASFDVLYGEWDIQTYDPQHPAANFPPFVKAMNRKVANGLGVAYNGFANDLESVNFSSMRSGVLDERDAWMDQQNAVIEDLLIPIFSRWQETQLLLPECIYRPWDFARINAARFLPRRWQWVDPQKDAQAKLIQLSLGATTPQDIAAELGSDYDDNVERISEALEILEPIQKLLGQIGRLKNSFAETGEPSQNEDENNDEA